MGGKTGTGFTAERPDAFSSVFRVRGLLNTPVPNTIQQLRAQGTLQLDPVERFDWENYHWLTDSTSHWGADVQALVAFSDDDLERANAFNCQKGISDEQTGRAYAISANKAVLYEKLQAAGVSVPKFLVASSAESLASAISRMNENAPVFIKPARGTGSRGVVRLQAGEWASASKPHLLKLLADVASGSSETVVMDAPSSTSSSTPEWSFDGVFQDGAIQFAALFEKVRQRMVPPLRDLAMVVPPRPLHSGDLLARVHDTALGTLQTLGVVATVFHIEMRVDDSGKLFPIDVALRPGGGFISEAIQLVHGVDIRLLHVLIQAGYSSEAAGLLSSAKATPGSVAAAAIGAFYWNRATDLTDSALESIVNRLGQVRKGGDLFFDLDSDLTTSAFSPADARMSLCIGSSDPDSALSNMDQLAHDLGFE